MELEADMKKVWNRQNAEEEAQRARAMEEPPAQSGVPPPTQAAGSSLFGVTPSPAIPALPPGCSTGLTAVLNGCPGIVL